jgi:type I restriction enzyme R subunit
LFLDFALQHNVSTGVQDLDQEKRAPLLCLRYQNSIADAVADLGKPGEDRSAVCWFSALSR